MQVQLPVLKVHCTSLWQYEKIDKAPCSLVYNLTVFKLQILLLVFKQVFIYLLHNFLKLHARKPKQTCSNQFLCEA